MSEFSLGVAPTALYLDNDALEDTYYRTAGIQKKKKEVEVEAVKGGEEGSKKEKDEESEDGSSASAGKLPYLPLPTLLSLHCNALSYHFLFSLPRSFVLHPGYSFSPYLHLSCALPSVNLIVNLNCPGTGRVSVADMGLGLPSPALLARDYRSVRAIQVPCAALHHSIITAFYSSFFFFTCFNYDHMFLLQSIAGLHIVSIIWGG